MKGLLVVISGPGGVGKGTVLKHIKETHKDLTFSISATSRSPRAGEVDGVNYFFKKSEEFKKMIEQDKLLEWVCFCGNYYGTPRDFVDEKLEKGDTVILEIEVEGATKIKKLFPDCVMIFIAPPNIKELERRIVGRATDSADVIKSRMEKAKEEMLNMPSYDYVIVNDTIEQASNDVYTVIKAESFKSKRVIEKMGKF